MMDDTTLNEMQQRLAELRLIFRQQLPGKLEEILSAWQQLSTEWSAERVGRLHQLCHSLAGSSLTFGAREVGDSARRLEQSVKEHANTAQPPEQAALEQLDELARTLAASCERWTASVPTPRQHTEK